MAFIGTPLDTRNTFQSLVGKRFNGDGSTTAFTLDVAPSSTLDLEVFVGNVRQDPNSAYTLSGTTLTFTGAPPSGTNNIYVVHQAKSVGTINAPANSITSDQLNTALLTGATDIGANIADADLFLIDDGAGGTLRKTAASRIKTYAGFSVSDITGATELAATPADTDELIISDAGTLKRIDFSHIKAGNYFSETAFMDNLASNTTVSNNTLTQLFASSTERFDLGSNYSSGTYTIPTTGYYIFQLFATLDSEANDNLRDSQILIRCDKDSGTDYQAIGNFNSNNLRRVSYSVSTGYDSFTAGDTLKVYGYINSGDGSTSLFNGSQDPLTFWYGYRVA